MQTPKTLESGHVSAITVAPSYRRLSLARSMMNLFESASDRQGCKFVDLYVRISNDLAIGMYESFGYSVFRRVLNYYSGQEDDEDAFGEYWVPLIFSVLFFSFLFLSELKSLQLFFDMVFLFFYRYEEVFV